MIIDGLAALLHDVERLRFPVAREILVDARGTRFAADRRVVRHGCLLPVFLHLRRVPRAVKLVRQVDPVHAGVVQPVRLVANVDAALLRRVALVLLVVRIAQPLVVVPHVLRRAVRLVVVVAVTLLAPLTDDDVLTRLRVTQVASGRREILGTLVLLRDVHLPLCLVQLQLSVQPLLLGDLLHDRQVPVVDLRRFPVPLESHGEIRPGLRHPVVFHGLVRLRDGVVRRAGWQLHDVDVAVPVPVSATVRLMDPRLGVEPGRFRAGQTLLVMPVGDLKRGETQPI